jgi:mannose-1-phosphate guanylyltransferase
VETDDDGRVRAFREKPRDPVPGNINAGVYVLEPEALDGVPPGETVSIERETYPRLIAGGAPVFAPVAAGYWRDLGTPEAYLRGHLDALEGRIRAYRGVARPLAAPTAEIDRAADVGSLVVVGAGVRVAGHSRVDRSVLHAGAVVERGALVEDSILGPGCVVEAEAEVRGAVLAQGARVPTGTSVEDETVPPGAVAPSRRPG